MRHRVPYLTNEFIERDAIALLSEFECARGVPLEPPIPIEDIIEKFLKLPLDFADMHELHKVPRPAKGETDILGAIYGDGSIFIDKGLCPDENPSMEGRYRFTLAHEGGGHWRLHRHLISNDSGKSSLLNDSGDPKFLCRVIPWVQGPQTLVPTLGKSNPSASASKKHKYLPEILPAASGWFREAVIAAYDGRCALSGLPEQRLLDAAHIISDKNERLGQPIVPNGLPLSKIHHAAFGHLSRHVEMKHRLRPSGPFLCQPSPAGIAGPRRAWRASILDPKRSAAARNGSSARWA